MTDLSKFLSQIRRPKLLVRAARMGLLHYKADRDMPRLVRAHTKAVERVKSLIAEEQRLEDGRQTGDSTYSIQSHVGILTALIAETRLRASSPTH